MTQQVDFVEEEDDGRFCEPARVDDGFEESDSFHHSILRKVMSEGLRTNEEGTYHALVLIQHLIVFAQAHNEDERSDVFEAMYPFPPLRPLAAAMWVRSGTATDF